MSCIDYDKRLYVYWNIQKKMWSVRQSGKVLTHTSLIFLKDCRFLVGKAGQARVRREGKKNVHAGVSGYPVDYVVGIPGKAKEITYNPYKHKTFVDKKTGRAVKVSDYAVLTCGNGWQDVEGIWS